MTRDRLFSLISLAKSKCALYGDLVSFELLTRKSNRKRPTEGKRDNETRRNPIQADGQLAGSIAAETTFFL